MRWKADLRFFLTIPMRCFGMGVLAFCSQSAPPSFRSTVSPSAVASAPQFAIADLDGDRQPDLAEVQVGRSDANSTRYSIRFLLTSGRAQSVPVVAPMGGLQLATRDVNGDSALDLVVSTTWLHRPVAVLLNDGRGHFTMVKPAAFPPSVWAPAPPSISLSNVLRQGTPFASAPSSPGESRRTASSFLARSQIWPLAPRGAAFSRPLECALFSRPPPSSSPA